MDRHMRCFDFVEITHASVNTGFLKSCSKVNELQNYFRDKSSPLKEILQFILYLGNMDS